MKKYLLVWLGVFIPLLATASEKTFTFKQISTQDGLSQNTVRSLLVDRRGFVWAGTLDGLVRYDGKHFVTYKPRPGNPATISDHRISGIHEDSDGYLWVRKYDNSFSCYRPETESFIELKQDGKTIPLPYNHYLETRDSSVWLWSGENGCIRIRKDHAGELLTDFYAPSSSLRLTHPGVQYLFEDSRSVVWVCCRSGLNRITPDLSVRQYLGEGNKFSIRKGIESHDKIYFLADNGTLIIYDQQKQTFDPPVHHPARFVDGALLNDGRLLIVSRDQGLIAYNPQTERFESSPFPSSIKGNIQLLTDRRAGIWIFNHTGVVWYYNAQMNSVNELALIPPHIASIIDFERYNIYIDSRNIYWITTYGNGLFCYNPASGQLDNYKYSAGSSSPASDYLLAITEDAASNMWIGTDYAGMIKVIRENYGIRFLRPEPEISIGKSNNVKTIFEDSDGQIWVGTKNGSLYLYDNNLQNQTCIRTDLNPYTITEDHCGRIWVGTKGNGIHLFDRRTRREIAHLRNNPHDTLSLSHDAVFQITADSSQRIWVATFGGGLNLVEEDGETIRFRSFFRKNGNRSKIRCVLPDSKGNIWAGSYDGLIRFKPEELFHNPAAFQTYNFDINNARSLSCNDVKTIYEDLRGRIWIGTAGGGLNQYIPASEKGEEHFVNYTASRQNLAGDMICDLLETPDEKLWISSESGLTRLDRKRESFMAFHFAERTYGNNFNENAGCLRKNGETLWGTLDGILVFDPAQFTQNRFVPPVIFTDFYLYDEKVVPGAPGSPLKQSISNTRRIDLNSKQNTFTIGFANLNLTEPNRNRYTYILEPYDRRWSRASNNNQITYKNLPPGKYVFKASGSNGDGRWNQQRSELEIVVHPPFWKSATAYAIYAAFALLLLYITFRLIYKFNNLNNTIKVEKQLTDYKLRFFTNISHEFRTPLTLIRGVVENLDEQQDLPRPVRQQINLLSRNANQMSRLIDQLLEFRKIQNNVLTLNLERTDMIKFAKEIYRAFSEMALRKQIDYRFTSSCESLDMYIDRGKVDKILFNLLSNAFKFTPSNGRIEVCIESGEKPPTCLISVKDSGIGIPKEKQHLLFSRFMQVNFSSAGTGVGLALVKEFTEVHKGKVWYEPNPQQGSVFRVSLPTSATAYAGENFIPTPRENLPEPNALPDRQTTGTTDTSAKGSPAPSGKVLVIDDNSDILDFLSEELCKHFKVETAGDGKEGLAKATELNPDLIICDVMMPEMDGFEVTRHLKNEFQTCHIPVILLTAHSSSEHQLEGIQSGADAYITKPFSLKYLMSRVNNLIEQREKLKKRFSVSPTAEESLLSNTDKDKEFFELINRILDKHMSTPTFSVDEFSELAGLKRTLFYKKIKGLTGFSPNELIKIRRMKKAAELLATGKYTVAEVSWQIGIEDPFYFSKCFKAQFGCSPSKYAQGGGKNPPD